VAQKSEVTFKECKNLFVRACQDTRT